MSTGGFIKNSFAAQIESITATNEDSEHPVANIVNGVPSEYFLSTSNEVEITIQFKNQVTMTAAALIYHNIPDGSTVTLKFSTDGISYPTQEAMTWNYPNLYKTFDHNCLYMKIYILVASGTVRIGEFYPGTEFQFPENWEWGFHPMYRSGKQSICVNGQWFEEKEHEGIRGWKLTLQHVASTYFEDFCTLFQAGSKIFVPDFDLPDCYHCAVPADLFDPERKVNNLDRFEIEIWENAIVQS